MKTTYLISILLVSIFFISSCKKTSNSSSNSLRLLKSPTGQNQGISANIDNTGFTNFNAQTILADGGNPISCYTWSLDPQTTPAGITIGLHTGVINRIGNSSTGLTAGTTTVKITVSDGSVQATGLVDLIITSYTPGPAADLQQLSSDFQLKNADANKPYAASLFVMGGTPPYQWKLDNTYSGSVDLTNAGLEVEGTYGIVRSTAFNSSSGKTINFKVIVTDATGEIAVYSPVYSITVN